MTVQLARTIEIARPREAVFALLEDVGRGPEWLSRCRGIARLDPGPNEVGSRLRYDYWRGKRAATMEGAIAAYVAPERIAFRYADRMFDVTIDFELAAAGDGTKLIQQIDIAPRAWIGRALQPLIRRVLPDQTARDLEKLRALV